MEYNLKCQDAIQQSEVLDRFAVTEINFGAAWGLDTNKITELESFKAKTSGMVRNAFVKHANTFRKKCRRFIRSFGIEA